MPDAYLWPLVASACAVAIVLAVAVLLWRRRRQPVRQQRPIEFVDVASLPAHGPAASGRQLTCYGVPVRVAVVVVAPSGRGAMPHAMEGGRESLFAEGVGNGLRAVPDTPQRASPTVSNPPQRKTPDPMSPVVGDVLDAAVPGLADVAREHAPRVDRWPAQLSAQGFMQAFFGHLRLPQDHGKGTPWTSAAGRVEHKGVHYLLGVVLCAERPNSLGEITIEHAGHWLDVLRLRD